MSKRVLTCLAVAFVLTAASAEGARVKLGTLVLRADGGFTPRTLPRHSFAPIAFEGYADVKETDGSIPPALQKAVVEFDRDGRLTTAGLPVCDPARLQEVTVEEGRSRCRGAIVGSGHIGVLIAREGGAPYDVSAPLTLFNGPPEGGHPTVVLHTRTTVPGTQNFVIVIPIERRAGHYRYRATVEVPLVSAGRGSLVHIDVEIGRRYLFRGTKRSYVSARCSDNVLSTRGRFTFAGDILIDGSVEKACTFR